MKQLESMLYFPVDDALIDRVNKLVDLDLLDRIENRHSLGPANYGPLSTVEECLTRLYDNDED